MKRLTILLIGLLTCLLASGQKNIFPDLFPRTKGIKEVIVKRDCHVCLPPITNEIVQKYYFDEEGFNIKRSGFYKNELCGYQIYNYYDGKLINYKNISTLVSTSKEGDFAMVWDSTILTNEVKYQFEAERLVNTKWIYGRDNRVSIEIVYSYDMGGRLQEEQITNYPDPNSFGQFEPNSDKWIDAPDARRLVINKIEYEYIGSQTTKMFYKEEKLTGIENIEKDNTNQIIQTTVKDTLGKILSQEVYFYNDIGQLIEKQMIDTGYDGFGNPYDFVSFEKESYEYDNKGTLKSRRMYSGGQLFQEERLEYIE